MKYKFQIRNNATGEIRTYDENFDWSGTVDEDNMIFMWTEGNYACDCNRELFFARAANEPDPEVGDNHCGSERFTVISALREDGETIQIDASDEPDPNVTR